MRRRSDSVSVTLHPGDLARIRTIRMVRGVDVGGVLWLGVGALSWVADAVNLCVESLEGSEKQLGEDTLRVREKGPELDPMVGIGNVRAGQVEHAGRYFLVIREDLAGDLIRQLRRLSELEDRSIR